MFDEHFQRLREAYRTARIQDFAEATSAVSFYYKADTSAASAKVAQQMRDFSLANGRDLEDVNRFLREVDYEIACSFLPS